MMERWKKKGPRRVSSPAWAVKRKRKKKKKERPWDASRAPVWKERKKRKQKPKARAASRLGSKRKKERKKTPVGRERVSGAGDGGGVDAATAAADGGVDAAADGGMVWVSGLLLVQNS